MSYLEKLFPSTSLNSTMPPARTSSANANTTKRAPFKAPSRVASGGTTTKPTKSKAPAPSKAKTGFQSAETIELSDDASSDDDDDEEEEAPLRQPVKSKAKSKTKAPARQEKDSDIDMDSDGVSDNDEPAPPARKQSTKRTLDPAMPIPPKLLTRILWEGFEDKDMKIGKEAMSVVGKYVETFVREAVARAIFERRGDDEDDELGDGFLQVEDLEKLTPQLLLDF